MNSALTSEYWRRCSSCKNSIAYQAKHFVCSVSTCTRKRVGYVFCSVHCWERHLPGARHRDAAAIEAVAPTFEQWKREIEAEEGSSHTPALESTAMPKRVLAKESPSATGTASLKPAPPQEILVVVSKLKGYIRARSDMNTSDAVMDLLSDRLRRLCDQAIDSAREEGRKTVLERDFK